MSAAASIAIADAHGGGGASLCSDENDAPNNASPRKVGSPKKRGEKRKSPSKGLGGMVLNPLPPLLPPPLPPSSLPLPLPAPPITRSITPPPPLQCRGVSEGFFGPALTFAAKSMEHTAKQLRQWAMEPDLGVKSFAKSMLSTSRSICIPYHGVLLDRASNLQEGFVFRAVSCSGNCSNGKRCSHCTSKIYVSNKVRGCIEHDVERVGKHATIANISRNPALAATEINTIRDENRRLRRQLAHVVLMDAIDKDGAMFPEGIEGNQIRKAVGIMDGSISKVLQSDATLSVELELWQVHAEHISKISKDGGKRRGRQAYHPMLMNWAIAFLARTSSSTYNEVAKIMMLPNISTVYRKTADLITTKNDKAYCLHMNTIRSISDRARRENWTSNQRIGAIAQDSANINSGIEHDYVTNTLKGGDESHSVATLSRMFSVLAQKMKDAECNEDEGVHQNSIMDNLPLAQEHLVFKFSSIDPHIKCSEIVASVNVTKVTPGVITSVIIALRDLLPLVGLHIGMATSDAAGCNWVSYRDTLSSHTFRDALPRVILDKYPMVNFDAKCLMTDPVTNEWIVFLPDMPHLTKDIATSLELSSSKTSKRNLMRGKSPSICR